MPQLNLKMRLISPTFVAGESKNHPELRAATVRGQVRYWLRAIIGARTDSLATLWDHESRAFGKTENGSPVTIRIPLDFPKQYIADRPLLPHREGTGKPESIVKAIAPVAQIDGENKPLVARLDIITRPGVDIPPDALLALKVWSLLGGMGRRSRRMMGAVRISSNDPQWYAAPSTPQEMANLMKSVLREAIPRSYQYKSMPSFPTLAENQSMILLSTVGFSTAKEANQELFRELLRTDKWRNSNLFGSATPRRASPLIVQVRLIGNQLYPVLTVMKSRPDKGIDWAKMVEFMQEAKEHYNAIHVWGNL